MCTGCSKNTVHWRVLVKKVQYSSQGNVVTRLRCGWIGYITMTNLPQCLVLRRKNFENEKSVCSIWRYYGTEKSNTAFIQLTAANDPIFALACTNNCFVKYCHQRVCMSISLSVRSHISKTTHPNFIKFSVHVTYDRSSKSYSDVNATCYHVMYFQFCGRRCVFT